MRSIIISLAGAKLLIATIFSVTILSSMPVSSQSTSCDVPPSSEWDESEDPLDYLRVQIPGGGYLTERSEDAYTTEERNSGTLLPLDKDISTEWSDGAWEGFPNIQVKNGSATVISMVLEPGKMYKFCIDFSSKGDVYLLTDGDLTMYTVDIQCDEDGWDIICEDGALDSVPVEYRDMFTWVPFRDKHAYESVSYQEFSVAIDSTGSAWSFAGFGNSDEQVLNLVLDGWDNSREDDHPASGNMSVEVLIEVEDRFTLPKTMAYVLIGSLPLSCIIIPLILHWKYHSSALSGGEEGEIIEVPYLKDT